MSKPALLPLHPLSNFRAVATSSIVQSWRLTPNLPRLFIASFEPQNISILLSSTPSPPTISFLFTSTVSYNAMSPYYANAEFDIAQSEAPYASFATVLSHRESAALNMSGGLQAPQPKLFGAAPRVNSGVRWTTPPVRSTRKCEAYNRDMPIVTMIHKKTRSFKG